MNRYVAIGTGLLRIWRVSCISLLIVESRRRQMALKADGVNVGQNEELWILASVRSMARRAANLFDRFVLVNPRSGQIGVALETCRHLLLDRTLQLLLQNGMRIVTGGTLHRAVIDLVMNGRGELVLDAGMASIA